MGVTIKDIAQEAGVSVATVSYVLNGTGKVSKEVGDKVRKIVSKHNYKPRERKSVATKVSKAEKIMVVLNPLADDNAFFLYDSTLVAGCEQGISHHGSRMVFHRYLNDENLAGHIEEEKPDGIILISGETKLQLEVPAVTIARPIENELADIIRPDDENIGTMAAERVLDAGCAKPAFIHTIANHTAFIYRRDVFGRRLAEKGLKVIDIGPSTIDAELFNQLVDKIKSGDVDSLFIPGSDANVIAACMQLMKGGINLHRRVNIIACVNNMENFNMLASDITMLNVNLMEIGQTAADAIHNRIKRPRATPKRYLVRPTMVK